MKRLQVRMAAMCRLRRRWNAPLWPLNRKMSRPFAPPQQTRTSKRRTAVRSHATRVPAVAQRSAVWPRLLLFCFREVRRNPRGLRFAQHADSGAGIGANYSPRSDALARLACVRLDYFDELRRLLECSAAGLS